MHGRNLSEIRGLRILYVVRDSGLNNLAFYRHFAIDVWILILGRIQNHIRYLLSVSQDMLDAYKDDLRAESMFILNEIDRQDRVRCYETICRGASWIRKGTRETLTC